MDSLELAMASLPLPTLHALLARAAPESPEEQHALRMLRDVLAQLPAPPKPVVGLDGAVYPCAWARDLATEPLLQDDGHRYTLFPIRHPDVFQLYEELRDKFWFAGEIKLTRDREDYAKLDPNVRHWVDMTLAFFASSDGLVLHNLFDRIISAVKTPESRHFFGIQVGNETIHSEMYSVLIEALVESAERKAAMFNAVKESRTIRRKAEWILAFINDRLNVSLGELFIAVACMEGIMFCSSFACIFNLRERGLMPGLCNANLMISGDEYKHMVNLLLHYERKTVNKLSPDRVLEIVRSAVEVEHDFVNESLPVPILGMSADLMRSYVCYVANFAVSHLCGIPLPYPEQTACPLVFMEHQGRQVKTNFFEHRAVEYQRPATQSPAAPRQLSIDTSRDF